MGEETVNCLSDDSVLRWKVLGFLFMIIAKHCLMCVHVCMRVRVFQCVCFCVCACVHAHECVCLNIHKYPA